MGADNPQMSQRAQISVFICVICGSPAKTRSYRPGISRFFDSPLGDLMLEIDGSVAIAQVLERPRPQELGWAARVRLALRKKELDKCSNFVVMLDRKIAH